MSNPGRKRGTKNGVAHLTCFRSPEAASYTEMSLQRSILLALGCTLLAAPLLGQTAAAPGQGVKPAKPAVASPEKPVVPSAAAAKPNSIAATTSPKKAATPTVQKKQVASKTAKGKKAPQQQAQLPPPPPPPPTPAQSPPNPPRVTMRNGLLTIEANNSTLADVLTGVRRETKAAIDLPAGASGERVVASLGPGTPQAVLTSLLNGSRFDYIILGSEDQPDAVQRVILRAKSGPEPAPSGPPLTAQRAPNPGGAVSQPVQTEDNDEQATPAEEAPDENTQQQQQQEIENEQQQSQQQQQQQQPGVKTPEQLLEELRQMQQQQQQNQEQQQQQPPQQQQPQIYQQPQPQPQQPQPDEQ